MDNSKCKRCGLKTVIPEEDIDKMVEDIKRMKGIKLVDEEVFNKRFKICRECDKFEYGSTCMLCGCVMQVRARLKNTSCPYPKNKKW